MLVNPSIEKGQGKWGNQATRGRALNSDDSYTTKSRSRAKVRAWARATAPAPVAGTGVIAAEAAVQELSNSKTGHSIIYNYDGTSED